MTLKRSKSYRQSNRKNIKNKSIKKRVNRKRTLTRKQKQLKKGKSFYQTLNQMGGFIRDGSTQFFKILKENLN